MMKNDAITMELLLVTPAMAENWLLNRNSENRNIRPWHANRLRGAIERGEWEITHQGIAFDSSGTLIDGQHRLTAIVLAKMAVPMLVFTYSRTTKATHVPLDEMAKRNVADAHAIGKKHAETASMLAKIDTGTVPTNARGYAYYLAFKTDIDLLISTCPSTVRNRSTASVRTAAVVLMSRYADEQKESIANQYRKLVTLELDGMWQSVAALASTLDKSGTLKNVQHEQLARSFIGLDPNKKDFRVIRVGNLENIIINVRGEIRSVMSRLTKGDA